jgi:hypothetical protein
LVHSEAQSNNTLLDYKSFHYDQDTVNLAMGNSLYFRDYYSKEVAKFISHRREKRKGISEPWRQVGQEY